MDIGDLKGIMTRLGFVFSDRENADWRRRLVSRPSEEHLACQMDNLNVIDVNVDLFVYFAVLRLSVFL